MGKVRRQLTGTVSGKVGNLVYRVLKTGESVVYPDNPDRKKPDTPAVIENNRRFEVTNKFAAAVNDSMFLKNIWRKQRNIKGKNAYNKIHSYNYKHAYNDFLGKYAQILPNGIYNQILNFKYTDNNVTVTFEPSEELLENFKAPFVAVILIYLNSPASKRKGQKVFDHNAYLTVEKEFASHKFVAGKPAKIVSQKYKNRFKIIDEYKRARVFLSLVFDSVSGKTMWTRCLGFTFKGVELDIEHDEMLNKESKKRKEATNKPKSAYHEFRLR